MTTDITKMTRKEFDAVPDRAWAQDIGEFDSLVVLPQRRHHDSGYRCMDFVACKEGSPLYRLSGCSDALHIDGIGGFGKWEPPNLPASVKPRGWSIDCLPVSGLLRLFSREYMTAGPALSSFEIFAIEKEAPSV